MSPGPPTGLPLNLTTTPDNRIVGIETIDITGTGNNTLTLNHREVLNISDETNTLIVRRNASDVVNIGPGWTQLANESISGTPFLVYAQGLARLKIQVAGAASLANRQIFYNRSTSTVFGPGSGNPINSIDSTKIALLPGQTTSFANYTNCSRGLNGIVVDVANVAGLFRPPTFNSPPGTGSTSPVSLPPPPFPPSAFFPPMASAHRPASRSSLPTMRFGIFGCASPY